MLLGLPSSPCAMQPPVIKANSNHMNMTLLCTIVYGWFLTKSFVTVNATIAWCIKVKKRKMEKNSPCPQSWALKELWQQFVDPHVEKPWPRLWDLCMRCCRVCLPVESGGLYLNFSIVNLSQMMRLVDLSHIWNPSHRGVWEMLLFFFLKSFQAHVLQKDILEGNGDRYCVPVYHFYHIVRFFNNEHFLAHLCSTVFSKVFKAFVCSFKNLFSTCNVLALF